MLCSIPFTQETNADFVDELAGTRQDATVSPAWIDLASRFRRGTLEGHAGTGYEMTLEPAHSSTCQGFSGHFGMIWKSAHVSALSEMNLHYGPDPGTLAFV
jgi:hypothetical protein